jgi:DNA-binding response OmpR family regulator
MNILFFEDNKITQNIVRKYTNTTLNAKTEVKASLINADFYLKTHYIKKFDLIICDYCFPLLDATEKLEELRDCGKPVLFYSALDYEDFEERVLGKLKSMPDNFQFVRKASNFRLLADKIKAMCGIK